MISSVVSQTASVAATTAGSKVPTKSTFGRRNIKNQVSSDFEYFLVLCNIEKFVVLEQAYFQTFSKKKFKGPFKSFEYWGLKLLPGIRVIAEGLTSDPDPNRRLV